MMINDFDTRIDTGWRKKKKPKIFFRNKTEGDQKFLDV